MPLHSVFFRPFVLFPKVGQRIRQRSPLTSLHRGEPTPNSFDRFGPVESIQKLLIPNRVVNHGRRLAVYGE